MNQYLKKKMYKYIKNSVKSIIKVKDKKAATSFRYLKAKCKESFQSILYKLRF